MEQLKKNGLLKHEYAFINEKNVDVDGYPLFIVWGVPRRVEWVIAQFIIKTTKIVSIFFPGYSVNWTESIPAYHGSLERKSIKGACM